MKINEGFGLYVEEEVNAYCGWRAIFNGSDIHFDSNRRTESGDRAKIDGLLAWAFSDEMEPGSSPWDTMLRAVPGALSPTSSEEWEIRNGDKVLRCSPNASGGYLYVSLFEVGEEPAEELVEVEVEVVRVSRRVVKVTKMVPRRDDGLEAFAAYSEVEASCGDIDFSSSPDQGDPDYELQDQPRPGVAYLVWGPDGLPVSQEPVSTAAAVSNLIDEFVGRYAMQGYYRDSSCRNLSLDELRDSLRVEVVDPADFEE